ncbi:MAG: prolipoprotein diacylglyceryl transferase [Ignavibacteriales bacterium]
MIEWSVDPEILKLGPFSLRWYGLLFAGAFLISFQIMSKIYRAENKSEKDLNDGLWAVILGTIIGARLGHCLFYNPIYYLSHPIEILQIWKGGLASHGAAIGILTAIYFYTKSRKGISYIWMMDRLVIVVALSGMMIRLGNLFNSEIIGRPTNSSWGFVFTAIDNVPRHPTQIYEALAYLAVFIILYRLYKTKIMELKQGYIFGLFLILVFGFRFLVEFLKEDQTYFEAYLPLNMGQILSIPLIALGIYLILRKVKTYSE